MLNSWRCAFENLSPEELEAHQAYLAEFGGPGYCTDRDKFDTPPLFDWLFLADPGDKEGDDE